MLNYLRVGPGWRHHDISVCYDMLSIIIISFTLGQIILDTFFQRFGEHMSIFKLSLLVETPLRIKKLQKTLLLISIT